MEKLILKKIRHFLIVLFLIIFIIFTLNTFFKEKSNYIAKDTLRAEKIFDNIKLKEELIFTSMEDLKNNYTKSNYFSSENPTSYDVLTLLSLLQIKNNFYSQMGYQLEVGKSTLPSVLTNKGTYDKNLYLKNLNFNENSNSFLSMGKKDIYLYLQNKNFNQNPSIFWIITLDKNSFFKEISGDTYGKWYIGDDKQISSINKNTPVQLSAIKGALKFKLNILKVNLYYVPNHILLFDHFFKEIFKISIILLSFYFIISYIITLLEKPLNKMGEQINTLALVDRRKNLRDFILGIKKFYDFNGLTKKLENIYNPNCKLVLIEIFDTDTDELQYEDFALARDYLKNSFINNDDCEYVDIDYKSILFIITEENSDVIEKGYNYLLENIFEKYKVKLIASVSDPIKSFNDFPKKYMECKRILTNKYLFKDKYILFDNQLQRNKISIFYSIEIENKLASKILNQNFLGSKKIIDDIFCDLNLDTDEYKIKEFGGLLYNTLSRVLIQMKETNSLEEENYPPIEEILKVKTIPEIKIILLNIVENICKQKKEPESLEEVFIKLKIETFIEKNYHLDFSLEDLADHLGLSFKYTSILFKKIMGDNFKNHVNLYRVSKAKEVLSENENVKIKDLAESLGFNSSNTFIKVFKKYEGVSPTQWIGTL